MDIYFDLWVIIRLYHYLLCCYYATLSNAHKISRIGQSIYFLNNNNISLDIREKRQTKNSPKKGDRNEDELLTNY